MRLVRDAAGKGEAGKGSCAKVRLSKKGKL